MEINSEIGKIIDQKAEKLLFLEKKKRKVDKDKLIFVGMADIAEYYWCAVKSLLQNRKMESAFFGVYLWDRIIYSYILGLNDKIPKNEEKTLEIGSEITFDDIETLLKGIKRERNIYNGTEEVDKDGNKVMIINPDLSEEERSYLEKEARSKGIRIANLEEFPYIRGEMLETTKAEFYPTIRWNFEWGNYVVVGVPDGITDNFVYEFKTTKNRYLMYFIKPVAFAQADLYGYFFKRNKKRIQIYIVNENKIETWEDQVDFNKATEVLENFKKIDEGLMSPPLPKPWKCNSCDFKDACHYRQVSKK